jgi:hypothetical protein
VDKNLTLGGATGFQKIRCAVTMFLKQEIASKNAFGVAAR